MKKPRILFILKRNECYGFKHRMRRSAGLWNSTRFIVEALQKNHIAAEIVEVQDNNCIDREVTKFKPDIVVIEALWVIPTKFAVLEKLHPHVKWFVHLHSHMPFLALEGIALEWIIQYTLQGIGIIANSKASYEALKTILDDDSLILLPNVFLERCKDRKLRSRSYPVLHVGCFGAIRPLKNHLTQALAAIEFAKREGKYLSFYINATRVETGGEPVLKNLRSLFKNQEFGELIECDWNDPEQFQELLSRMDVGMQVSLSETFNVVSANYVAAGLPIVVSKEVSWASMFNKAQDDSIKSIVATLERVWRSQYLVKVNQLYLWLTVRKAIRAWVRFAKSAGRK